LRKSTQLAGFFVDFLCMVACFFPHSSDTTLRGNYETMDVG
jgi:hypothetical protein